MGLTLGDQAERVVLTGLGHVAREPDADRSTIDARPLLRERKSRKFMGVQDELAVIAAARATSSAGLGHRDLGDRTGLFMAVGHIPFEAEAIDQLLDASLVDGTLSMMAFSTSGLERTNPLLTFRCLPNMPAFHVSANLGITGPCVVAYPGAGQLYLLLELACQALASREIEAALVGGVADQCNFLVSKHFARLMPPCPAAALADAAGFFFLERAECAQARSARAIGHLDELTASYRGHDPFTTGVAPSERFLADGEDVACRFAGDHPASLPVTLSVLAAAHREATVAHTLTTRDGFDTRSRWRLVTGSAEARRPDTAVITVPGRQDRHRVVVTGMGVVSPLGANAEQLRDGLLSGCSGIGPITVFDPAALASRVAGEAVARGEAARLRDRKIAFALDAAEQAMTDACRDGRGLAGVDGGGGGLCLGVGLEVFSLVDMARLRHGDGGDAAREAHPLTFLQTPSDLCVHLISHRHGSTEPPLTLVSACAAGADAIGIAFRLLASGRRRWMLAGGTDSMVNPLGVGGFGLLGAVSTRNQRPAEASRPFDRSRDGFVLGEGAAVVVLERLPDALARGAAIHAEVIGYGSSLDAHAITAPDPEGRGALLAMRRALQDAGVGPEDVGCIKAHGTGTPLNDRVEALALRELLGGRTAEVPVYAPKASIGHLISAAGAVEIVAAIACMQAGRVPPVINLEDPDNPYGLDLVQHAARPHEPAIVLCNSFGFGGVNACVLLRRWDGA